MKYLVTKKPSIRSINLDNTTDITVSANYLVITAVDGREEKFVYGAEKDLERLFDAIMEFIASDLVVFNCDAYMNDIR